MFGCRAVPREYQTSFIASDPQKNVKYYLLRGFPMLGTKLQECQKGLKWLLSYVVRAHVHYSLLPIV